MLNMLCKLHDRWLQFRDRLLMNPEFLRRAARTPLVRRIAQRRARQTFDLLSGFVYSQVLLACVRLNLLHILAQGPATVSGVARELGIEPDRAGRLLRAAAVLGLAEVRRGERFGLGPLGAPLLADPGLLALIEHNQLLYADLTDPVALLAGEPHSRQLSDYWAYARAATPGELSLQQVEHYTALMGLSQAAVAQEVLGAYSFTKHRTLLDVGGGNGAFCAAVAAVTPATEFIVADLPAVAAQAERHVAALGLGSRIRTVGVDFLADELPAGADIATLIRVVHDHDDADVVRLLTSIRAALAPNGVLLIAEQLADTPGAETVGDVYFGFYLLAMGSGRPRSRAEIARLLERGGFYPPAERTTRVPLQARVLVARPRLG